MRENEFRILKHGVQHATVYSLDDAVRYCNIYGGYGIHADMVFYHYGVASVTLVESSSPGVVASLLLLEELAHVEVRCDFDIVIEDWLQIIKECRERKIALIFNKCDLTQEIMIIKAQGSYGCLLPIELGVEINSQGRFFYLVGEDLISGEYSTEIFDSIKEAEEAFERRLEERRDLRKNIID